MSAYLEKSLKYFFAKSTTINDSPRATASDALTGTDYMAAFGLADSKAGIGFDLFLAKHGVSSPEQSVESLYQYALTQASQYSSIAKLSTDIKRGVLQTLAMFAFQDYSRSAASVRPCECCSGQGFIDAEVFTTKTHTPWVAREIAHASVQFGLKVIPSSYEVQRQHREKARVLCHECKGKKVISNACRCHGKGKVIDRQKTELQGVPVESECCKCNGLGYSRLKFSAVLAGLKAITPDIGKSTAYEQFKPFYEMLIIKCFKEEAIADDMLRKVMKGENIAA